MAKFIRPRAFFGFGKEDANHIFVIARAAGNSIPPVAGQCNGISVDSQKYGSSPSIDNSVIKSFNLR